MGRNGAYCVYATFIQTPSRQQILIDGGPSVEAISLLLGKEMPFWDKSLDLVILTHPHQDHLAGLVEVVRRYKVEKELLHQQGEMRSAVLKIAHHGSHTSTSERFLAVVDPEVAVISVGKDNLFGHPDEETIARLSQKVAPDQIYLTSERGTITFTTDGKKLWVRDVSF